MKTIRRYFAVYIPLLISFIAWIVFVFCWGSVYYQGYEAGFIRGRNLTIEQINVLLAEDGVEFQSVEE